MSITKIIHQIWIGPKPLPDKWTNNIKLMAEKADFEYKLWRDDDIFELKLTMQNIYDACPEWYGKADVARYEILKRFGGIYIDADSVCVNDEVFLRLIKVVSAASAFIGFEPASKVASKHELIANGVFGTAPDSNFINACVEEVKTRFLYYGSDWPGIAAWQRTGPKLTTKIIEKLGSETRNSDNEFVDFIVTIDKQDIFLIKDYIFYPVTWHGISSIELPKNLEFHPSTLLYQFGYSTNKLDEIIDENPLLETNYAINLHDRTDRWETIRNDMSKFCNLRRINAIKDTRGAVGCMKSHLLSIETTLINSELNFLTLFEDDFLPSKNFGLVWPKIKKELTNNNNWEVAILAPSGYGCLKITGDIVDSNLISGVAYSLAMVCYSKRFISSGNYQKLKDISETKNPQPIDVWLCENLTKPGQCLLPLETLGSQRPSFSDIENVFVDYTKLFDEVDEKLFILWSDYLY